MGPILWVNAELIALQHLFFSVEIWHSVYSRSQLIQGQPHEGAAPGGLGNYFIIACADQPMKFPKTMNG